MEKKLEESLRAKYPEILRDLGGDPSRTCMAWGIECGEGWYDLLDGMMEKIRRICLDSTAAGRPMEVVADQIKEKFGTLCFYYHEVGSSATVSGILSDIVSSAERRSSQICEVCGRHGARCRRGGWLKTLDREHALALGYTACDPAIGEYWSRSAPEKGCEVSPAQTTL